MSTAIYGHGYRPWNTVIPRCKCGWKGTACGPGPWYETEQAAKKQFERHKTQVRHDTGPEPKGRVFVPKRRLRVVS